MNNKLSSAATNWFIPKNAHLLRVGYQNHSRIRAQAEPLAPRVYCNPNLPAGWQAPAELDLGRKTRQSRRNGVFSGPDHGLPAC